MTYTCKSIIARLAPVIGAAALAWLSSIAPCFAAEPPTRPAGDAQAGRAADILVGDWQGTLSTEGERPNRKVFHIVRTDGDLGGRFYFDLDETAESVAIKVITLQNGEVTFANPERGSLFSFHGKLSPDGSSISGVYAEDKPYPLELRRATAATTWLHLPGKTTYVTVGHDVRLQVVDWGGSGRPVILLTGMGSTAHVFDKFAAKLAAHYHVYGITRRGFGESSVPPLEPENYDADRLGDDVLEVMAALKIERPVIMGHSIAGEELSSIGSRRPEKVAGLVYLDSGFPFAFYDREQGNINIDTIELRRTLTGLLPGYPSQKDRFEVFEELLNVTLPRYERVLRERLADHAAHPLPKGAFPPIPQGPDTMILAGMHPYTAIPVPILALYAAPVPGAPVPTDPRGRAEAERLAGASAYGDVFGKGLPSAHVVRIPGATHDIFKSKEAQVLSEVEAFIAHLPPERSMP